MKTLLISGLIVASGVFYSCQSGPDTSGAESTGTDTVVTGLEGTRDQQAQISSVKTDSSSGQSPAGASVDTLTTNGGDDQFIKDQVGGNYDEIDIVKLAAKKSADKEIKAIAASLLSDHSKVLDRVKKFASDKKLDVATAPSAAAQQLAATLETKQAAEFDKAWTEALIEKHKRGIAKYESAANTITDPALKDFVNETLPKLRMHLDKLMAYHGQIK